MERLRNYHTSASKICLMGCITDVLNYYGFALCEGALFVHAEGSMPYYKPFSIDEYIENSHTAVPPFPIFGGMRYDIPFMLDRLQDNLNLKINRFSVQAEQEARDIVTAHISQGMPVLSLLSRKFLPYMHKGFQDDVTHCINVIGCDTKALFVSDTYIPTNPVTIYEGTLSVSDFIKSVNASIDIFYAKFPFNCITISQEDPQAFQRKSLTEKLEPFRNLQSQHFASSVNRDGYYVGLRAYEKLLEDMDTWFAYCRYPIFTGLMAMLHAKITNFGGPVITNSLLSDYFCFLSSAGNMQILNSLGDMFLNLGKKWLTVGNLCGKASVVFHNNSGRGIKQKLSEVIALEREIYTIAQTGL